MGIETRSKSIAAIEAINFVLLGFGGGVNTGGRLLSSMSSVETSAPSPPVGTSDSLFSSVGGVGVVGAEGSGAGGGGISGESVGASGVGSRTGF